MMHFWIGFTVGIIVALGIVALYVAFGMSRWM